MKVHTNIDHLPAFSKAVITIGTFDGVHRGHQQILDQLLKEASAINGTPIVISFFPHPKQVVGSETNPSQPIRLLNTAEEKYELLEKHGVHEVVIVPFDKTFAQQSAESYIREFLVNHFHPHTIIIGYDHRFGRNREGNYRLLEEMAEKYHYRVKEIPEHVLQDVTISSTRIRTAMLEGDIDTAERYLGYKYFFSGEVVRGNQLGRTIGFPTANLMIQNEQKLVPANGVYAVSVTLGERQLKGMMNIGLRPTVDGTKRVIEVNIFDFDEMIYGSTLKITMVKHLRNEVKFAGLDALKQQLARDKQQALDIFS